MSIPSTPVTPKAFIQVFPEFDGLADDPQILFWIKFGSFSLSSWVWGGSAPDGSAYDSWEMRDFGILFFAAHNVALALQAAKSAGGGATPGMSAGILNSKSVDKASAGYDTASVMDPEAGHWNLTIYGQKFARMARQIGSIPIYVGAGGPADVAAWPGPIPYLGYTGW